MLQHQSNECAGYEVKLNHIVQLDQIDLLPDIPQLISRFRIAIVFYIYHTVIVDEICNRLASIEFAYDLIVVIPENSPSSTIDFQHILARHNPTILTCSNMGKDIGGKLEGLLYIARNQLNYDYVILAHDKVSDNQWRRNLYDEIFRQDLVNRVVNGFITDPRIKLAGGHIREGFVDGLYIVDHNISFVTFCGENLPFVHLIMEQVLDMRVPASGAYVAGTMFWMDWMYFKNIFTADRMSHLISMLEPGQFSQPSIAHAMERVFGILATVSNCKIGKVGSGYGYPDIGHCYKPRFQ